MVTDGTSESMTQRLSLKRSVNAASHLRRGTAKTNHQRARPTAATASSAQGHHGVEESAGATGAVALGDGLAEVGVAEGLSDVGVGVGVALVGFGVGLADVGVADAVVGVDVAVQWLVPLPHRRWAVAHHRRH